ncbi:MAG: zinc ribbon domain-containing protein [Candidatus Ornithomonoglobus sp.]
MRKCPQCGYDNEDSALFCIGCGSKLAGSEIFCAKCGYRNQPGTRFCGGCGAALNKDNKKTNTVAVACIAAAAAVIAAAVIAFIAMNVYNGSEAVKETLSPTETPTETVTEPPTEETPPVQVNNTVVAQPESGPPGHAGPKPDTYAGQNVSSRYDPYSPSLTYNRMSGIKNSWLTDDSTYYTLQSVITGFDSACEAYMNTGDLSILGYLRSGTTAYNQQTGYKAKHPDLTQYYTNIDVINSRTDGTYYYVWVTESMNVTENGTSKSTTDHWVYKIENIGGQWYINDYTADPLYK